MHWPSCASVWVCGDVASVRVKAVWEQTSLSQPCGCEGEGSVVADQPQSAMWLWGWGQCGSRPASVSHVASVRVKALWEARPASVSHVKAVWEQTSLSQPCGLCEGEGSVGGQTSLSQPCGLCEGESSVGADQPQSAMWPLWGWR